MHPGPATAALFILVLAALLAYTVWVYRRTLPPVSVGLRVTLAALRGLSLAFLAFLLFFPILRFEFIVRTKAVIPVLVDRSASMCIPEAPSTRKTLVTAMLHSQAFRTFRNRYQVPVYPFGERLGDAFHGIPDSLECPDRATDLAGALRAVTGLEPELRAVLVLSDGAQNSGENLVTAALSLGKPVYTVTVGRDEEPADLILTRMNGNETPYCENETAVEAAFKGPGFSGKRVMIRLYDNGREAGSRQVTVPEAGMEQAVRFLFVPKETGYHTMVLEIEHLQGELTRENNRREFLIRVLDSRMEILMVAGAPGPDAAFIRRLLDADENVSLQTRFHKKDGTFYEGPLPPEALAHPDVLVLLNMPVPWTPPEVWSRLVHAAVDSRCPLLWIGGERVDLQALKLLGSRLPFACEKTIPEMEVMPRLAPEGEWHPVSQLELRREANRGVWDALPPVFTCLNPSPVPGSRVLLDGIPESGVPRGFSVPLLIARHAGNEKELVFTASHFYRWGLMTEEKAVSAQPLGMLLSNMVRWLSVREEEKKVTLLVNKLVFEPGEEVVFTVRVHDALMRPLEGASVRVETGPPAGLTLPLEETGQGGYENACRFYESGPMTVKAYAEFEGRTVGTDSAVLHMSSFNIELLNTRANPLLMESLARASGGKAVPPDSLESLLAQVDFPEKTETKRREIELHSTAWALAAAVLLLSVEWLIRKRKGML